MMRGSKVITNVETELNSLVYSKICLSSLDLVPTNHST